MEEAWASNGSLRERGFGNGGTVLTQAEACLGPD